MVLLPREYYVGVSCLQRHPYPIYTFHFSPSPAFILLVIAPFIVSIALGLWKKWSEFITFGTFSLAVVVVTLLLLYLFEKSWIPVASPIVTSAVLYGPFCGKMKCPTREEKLVWVATSLMTSFILCIMVWADIGSSIN
ncbi:hypothetical protein [Thermococcus indicus]|uniref:hypothetical protein n=1 Tax=Thermococcus indicus TaxID=2586643 RepID=UPI001F0FA8E4|nr:hypothetical protein [Thermococcus indicus]